MGGANSRDSAHLDAIATADEAFRIKLEKIGLGARLGKTNMPITDDAVVRVARACPNLKNLRLDSALLITGTCIPAHSHGMPKHHFALYYRPQQPHRQLKSRQS